jgi:two-component system, OmpR family, phosphate regulon sensor histidine kinase PhoR
MSPLVVVLSVLCCGFALAAIWFFTRLKQAGVPLADSSKSLRQRNNVLESVLEGLGDSCLLVNQKQDIIFANHETYDLFRTSGELNGRPLADLIQDEAILAFVARVAKGNRWQEEEFRMGLLREGAAEERYLVVSAAPVRLFGQDGSNHLRVVIRDETDRHETEQIRKDFVANASHELRTPLSIINGYLENLLDGVIDDPAMTVKSLQTMQKHGERIARIVEDMLTLSKFESASEGGPASLRQNSFSCRECVEDVVDRLGPKIEEKKARVELSFPADGSDVVDADRFYWDQIFFNLIENALKENQDDGKLVLSIGFVRARGESVIRISDNGVGIPRADLPFIFKRFYRVAKHHSQTIKGTGLGLSIVRRAIESHGGTIAVDSTLGVETTFTIRLPDQVPAAAPLVIGQSSA